MSSSSSIKRAPRRGIFPHVVAALLILLAGLGSGLLAGSGNGDPWFATLAKPWFMPPGWVFPIVWTTLYLLMGLVLGDLLVAPSARARTFAITLFCVQLILNLAWSPVFFAAHRAAAALALILVLDLVVVLAVIAIARVRPQTAAFLLPYCTWLALATALNAAIVQLN